MRPSNRRPNRPQPKREEYPAFKILVCTQCGLVQEDEFSSHLCGECHSYQKGILHYVHEPQVKNISEAIAFVIEERFRKELERLQRIVSILHREDK